MVLAGAFAAGVICAQVPSSVWDGIYSTAQAGRGEALYKTECASCHGDKLQGKGQTPPLAGADFIMNWNGMMIGDLFDKMQTSMPADQPGRLSPEQNATILAYILSANKFPSGATDLSSDTARLKQIRFEEAKGK